MVSFPEPTQSQPSRAETVLVYLDYFRERAIEKVESLGPHDVVSSRVPSGWSPIELLNHLMWVERRWIEWGFLGLDVGDPWSDEIEGRWQLRRDVTPESVIEDLRAQGRRTREVVLAHGLDEVGAPGPRWDGAEPATLERVLLHLVQECSRHLGHLDVVVELAVGA